MWLDCTSWMKWLIDDVSWMNFRGWTSIPLGWLQFHIIHKYGYKETMNVFKFGEIWRNFPIKRVYATKMYLFSHLCKISHHKRLVGIGFLSSILWYWKFSNLSPNNYKKMIKFKLGKKKIHFFAFKKNMHLQLCNKEWNHLMCLSYFLNNYSSLY
jgi:hypothetical protein